MLGNDKVHTYHVPSWKKAAQTKNEQNFLVELKPLFLASFLGSRTQFQSKRLVMLRTDVYVTADLYQAKEAR